MRKEAIVRVLGALAFAMAAAQFGYARYQPVVFGLGWLFFQCLQAGINRLIHLRRMRKGLVTDIKEGLSLGQHPTFRICLVVALVVAFSLSIIFHRGFFFGAGMVWAWMLQSYLRQFRQLGIHRQMALAFQALLQ